MKAQIAWVIGLCLMLVPGLIQAKGSEPLSVEDVLRLHFAGVGDEVIISEIIVTESIFELGVGDILRLTEAGLSDQLVKFMIDTRITEWVSTEETPAESSYLEDDSDYADTWTNVIEEEPEETTTRFVQLNYNYSSWWYQSYWSDYWYWDCGYTPYRNSFVVSMGAWYPGWYSYGSCYSPPAWGYRSDYYAHHGYDRLGAGYAYTDSYYYHDGGYALSQTKYKGGGGGRFVANGPKLQMNDGRRLTATKGTLLASDRRVRKTRDGKVLLVDRMPTRSGGKRPTRAVASPTRTGGDRRGVRKPTSDTQLADATVRTPSRTVRSPASGGRPTKVRAPKRPTRTNTLSGGKPNSVTRRPSASRPSGIRSGGTKAPPRSSGVKTRTPTRTPRPAVRSAPRGNPRPAPSRAPAARRPAPSRGGGKTRGH